LRASAKGKKGVETRRRGGPPEEKRTRQEFGVSHGVLEKKKSSFEAEWKKRGTFWANFPKKGGTLSAGQKDDDVECLL